MSRNLLFLVDIKGRQSSKFMQYLKYCGLLDLITDLVSGSPIHIRLCLPALVKVKVYLSSATGKGRLAVWGFWYNSSNLLQQISVVIYDPWGYAGQFAVSCVNR